jgi:sterol 3beta-glucosyltransferase
MHLTIVTLGSRGDIQPYVALGSGLRSAGYEIALATHREFEPMIMSYDLGFREVGTNPREMGRTDVKGIGANPIKLRRWLKEQFQEGTENVLAQLEQVLQDTNGIIFSLYGSGAYHLAEARGIPSIAAYLQPTAPTGAFPSIGVPILPRWMPLRGVYNRMTHTITGALMWQLPQEALNRWRTENLGLAPLTLKGLQERILNERFPMLLGYSPSVLPSPRDWPDHIYVTGYWFLEQSSQWTPHLNCSIFWMQVPRQSTLDLAVWLIVIRTRRQHSSLMP